LRWKKGFFGAIVKFNFAQSDARICSTKLRKKKPAPTDSERLDTTALRRVHELKDLQSGRDLIQGWDGTDLRAQTHQRSTLGKA
jgi:hypothetical protein